MTVLEAGTPAAPKKRRVAILGGGCGGMAAAWGLVNSERAAEFDITVYQLGWRLGGKGASGRNAAIANRIEEHGLHIWGGMYENAFAIMRQVYGQLKRPKGTPLSVWYDPNDHDASAFLPHSNTTLAEFYDGRWLPWNVIAPSNGDLPGDGKLLPPLDAYLDLLIDLIGGVLFGDGHRWQQESGATGAASALGRMTDAVASAVSGTALWAARRVFGFTARRHVKSVKRALKALPSDARLHTAEHHRAVHDPLRELEAAFERMFDRWLDHHPGIRRIYMVINLGNAVVHGVLEDHILEKGIDVVDGEEFRVWLKKHGASDLTLNGVLVRGWHDFFFAYVDGDGSRPSLSAASGLRTLFRYAFTYRGAFFWKMQAGMGDTIFTPIYQALKQRGVKFRFFHRVEGVGLKDGATVTDEIQTIVVRPQVALRPGLDEYQPLVPVEGVDSWPSEPLYDQIDLAQAKRLQDEKINLESWWTPWKGLDPITLTKGRDFDDVILAMPPAAARHITGELAARSPRWAAMLENLASNQTVAAQIWLAEPLDNLGWPHGSTVGTVYADPLNTWANMDQLLKRESWAGRGKAPKSVIYFCGTLIDAVPIPPFSDHGFPATQYARAMETSLTWMDNSIGPLYPAACEPGTPQLKWSLLDPGSPAQGQLRFERQYWRLNIDPSERYVLSLPGSVSYRMRAHESGFRNLYLAGDWLRTGINAGCVEAAVMGGLQASQAMSGFPKVIVGDDL